MEKQQIQNMGKYTEKQKYVSCTHFSLNFDLIDSD
jgi:hypothetical protein